MKLTVLPYGQCALKGQTVNFPVNTSEVCSLLPRTLDNAGIVLIAPPRTGSSDSPVPQSYFSVCNQGLAVVATTQFIVQGYRN